MYFYVLVYVSDSKFLLSEKALSLFILYIPEVNLARKVSSNNVRLLISQVGKFNWILLPT